jgi:MFS family permease
MILLVTGLFIAPMKEALGWSTSAVAIAPIITLAWALSSPFAGAVIDRIGSRRAAITGSIALAACAVTLSLIPITKPSLYIIAILMGLTCSLTLVPTYARAVMGWFERGLGLALGLTLSGSALVSIIGLPLIGGAIEGYGWRAGFLMVAALIILVGLPAILFGCREQASPVAQTQKAGANRTSLTAALSNPVFWLYNLAFACGCVAIGGFAAHLQPLLAMGGIPLSKAVTLGVVFALSVTAGRIGGGYLLDRFKPFMVAAAVLAVSALGALGIAMMQADTAFVTLVLIVGGLGMGQGAEGDFPAFFSRRSFDLAGYSTVVGVFVMTTAIGLAAGAMIFSLIADRYSDYAPAAYLGAGCYLAAAVTIMVAGLVEARRSAQP